MKYVETVDANIWDSGTEAQVDKIIEWLTVSAPNMFDYDSETSELRVQTEFGVHTVRDGDAIILAPSKTFPEVMNGRAFYAIYQLLNDEI